MLFSTWEYLLRTVRLLPDTATLDFSPLWLLLFLQECSLHLAEHGVKRNRWWKIKLVFVMTRNDFSFARFPFVFLESAANKMKISQCRNLCSWSQSDEQKRKKIIAPCYHLNHRVQRQLYTLFSSEAFRFYYGKFSSLKVFALLKITKQKKYK